LRRELRKLRGEEVKKTMERKKQQDKNRFMEFLSKDIVVNENLANLKKS
jgi:hypothetical protein